MTVASDSKSVSLKPLKEGTAYIVAQSVDDPTKTQTFTAAVGAANLKPVSITIEKNATTEPDSIDMLANKSTMTLKATVTWSDGHTSTPSVDWSTSDATVAKFSGDVATATGNTATVIGKVALNKTGTAKIKAQYSDGNTIVDKAYTVSVKHQKHANQVQVTKPTSGSTLELFIGESYMMQAGVLPTDAIDSSVTYSSMDTSIATVDKYTGKVTAYKTGETSIIVSAVDQAGDANHAAPIQATQLVKVKQPITSITLNKTSLSMTYGTTNNTITASTKPVPNSGSLAVKSSDTSIATAIIATDGVVTVTANSREKAGTATITVYAVENPNVKAEATVTVSKAVIGKATNVSARLNGKDVVVNWTAKASGTLGDTYMVYLMSGSDVVKTYYTDATHEGVAVGTNTATFRWVAKDATTIATDNQFAFENGKTYSVAVSVKYGSSEGELSDAFSFTYSGSDSGSGNNLQLN
jgi:uncharacterized protein YjdB